MLVACKNNIEKIKTVSHHFENLKKKKKKKLKYLSSRNLILFAKKLNQS
jgi:hypothetical protein